MDPQAVIAKNAQVRYQFNQDCLLLKQKISGLQAFNNRLSGRLQALILKQTRLIDQARDLLTKEV